MRHRHPSPKKTEKDGFNNSLKRSLKRVGSRIILRLNCNRTNHNRKTDRERNVQTAAHAKVMRNANL